MNVGSQAKMNPRGFIQVYRTKAREETGLSKVPNVELASSGEGVSKIMMIF